MKYKTQDVEDTKNPMLDDITDLLIVSKEFLHIVKCYNEKYCKYNVEEYIFNLSKSCKSLFKLAVSLDPKHIGPTLDIQLKPFESIKELKDYEEKYYNMLKEIAENALEEKEVEVMAYLFDIIRDFEHYFCTLDEDDVPRETSSE